MSTLISLSNRSISIRLTLLLLLMILLTSTITIQEVEGYSNSNSRYGDSTKILSIIGIHPLRTMRSTPMYHHISSSSSLSSSSSSRLYSTTSTTSSTTNDRKELWKSISGYEKKAVELLSSGAGSPGDTQSDEALKLLAKSVGLKKNDPFIMLAESLSIALEKEDTIEVERLLKEMKNIGVPPHLASLIAKQSQVVVDSYSNDNEIDNEDVDPGSTFSDTVTEKIRVKVSSFYDSEKSDPANGKYMFWYKVGIYNEGSEPVQIVARMWEIEKCKGEKEVVRGAGIMSTQPIIPPGDVFTYQSVCPLKVFPAKGKRLLGSMSGAYTMCKGNMGQHNFTVKVGKFNLILPSEKSTK